MLRGGVGNQLAALARLVDARLLRHQRLDDFPGAGAQLQVFGWQQLLADHHQIGIGRQHASVAGPQVGVQCRQLDQLDFRRESRHVKYIGVALLGRDP
jgi:hypothetical protein